MVVSGKHIVFTYILIVGAYLLVLLSKRFYYRFNHGREYIIIPELKIKSISGISMMTAMNIALIITISLLSNQIMGIFFKVYPGARFLIENVLIKLGGLMFGPLIGIFIGLTTDLLTVILTSSVFNYGYFFSAMISGFLGGFIHLIIKIKDPKKILNGIAAMAMNLFGLIYLCYLLRANSEGRTFSARILSLPIFIPWYALFLMVFFLVMVGGFVLFLSIFCLNNINNPKYMERKWVKYFAEKYLFLIILVSNYSIYLFVDIISLPLFDINLSSLPYEQFLISRLVTSIPFSLAFSFLIHYIYKLQMNTKVITLEGEDAPKSGLQPYVPPKKKTFRPTLIH